MGAPPYVRLKLVTSTYTYGCTTFSRAYVGYLFFHNHWVSLVGAPPLVEPMLVTFFFTITGFYLSYGCPALSAAFYCYVYLQNQWIILN